jgi:hypothetical protein
MELIWLFLLPIWLAAGVVLRRPRCRAGATWAAALLGLAFYVVLVTGIAVLYCGWQSDVFRPLGIGIAVLGHAAFFGWLCSPAGAALTLAPIEATIGRLLGRPCDGQETLLWWDRRSTIVATVFAALDLALVFGIALTSATRSR